MHLKISIKPKVPQAGHSVAGQGEDCEGLRGVDHLHDASMLREMWLALSADFGVGNSRSIGFGAVNITSLFSAPSPQPSDATVHMLISYLQVLTHRYRLTGVISTVRKNL